MKTTLLFFFTFCVVLILVSCGEDNLLHHNLSMSNKTADASLLPAHQALGQGAPQISGIGFFDADDKCNSAGEDATFSLILTGDLEGCLYTYVDEYDCTPGGIYLEVGREYFVGTYRGESGTFWTKYRFEAKFEGCAEDGSYVGAEIKGRCQHPIVAGTGTGVFEGVTGRLDFKDDIEAGNYPYRGHLRGLEL